MPWPPSSDEVIGADLVVLGQIVAGGTIAGAALTATAGNVTTPSALVATNRIEHVNPIGLVGFFGAPPSVKAPNLAALVDNSGGVAANPIAAITNAANPGSADVGPTAAAVAQLAVEVSRLKTQLLAYGLG